ncbi:MAG: glycosyltransferase family 4 protein [Candidatus Aenigmarchaeota archaeon]|nr:glycosyltransferase family 4 protein [Candidatus Aenigmarchaeota archaeon]
MKICLISKYPPIEGGVSSKNYWVSKALGKMGHKVYVVTNSWEVEDDYREFFRERDLDFYQPKNVKVFNTDPLSIPHYIPYSKSYVERISSLAIEVIEKYDIDLIDSKYLIPYVVAGYFASHFTEKPQILRHAGSDIRRLIYSPYMNTLLIKILKSVDTIATYPFMVDDFKSFGVPDEKLILLEGYSVDTNEFSPDKSSSLREYGVDGDVPLLTFVGKPHRSKGIFHFLRALKRIKSKKYLALLLIGKRGRYQKEIIDAVNDYGLNEKVKILDFVPPWKMPKIFASSTAVILPEYNFGVDIHLSLIPREAMASGTCPVISKDLYNKYSWIGVKDGKEVVVIDPANSMSFSKKLSKIIDDPRFAEVIGANARRKSESVENFVKYISRLIEVYESVL